MINTQKTGAYISQLRKSRNITQAEMAARLMVSPQAVSKWETGQALPDPEQLLTLSQLFNVTVNAILLGENTEPINTTSESLLEEPADDSDEPPLVPPVSRPDQATIVKIAPFIEDDVLCDMIEQCGIESFTLDQMVALAPFLEGDVLDRYMEHVGDADIDNISSLAPFLSPNSLDHLVQRLDSRMTIAQLQALAPFLSSESLGELFLNRLTGDDGDRDFEKVMRLAPFLPSEMLTSAIESKPPRSFEELQQVAPFLDSQVIYRVARELMARTS
jgi:transcriptional regulator with XRE-family HTH domain